MTISGGTIEDKIFAGSLLSRNWPHQSLITIEGSDFQVNGQPVNYGDFASDYAVPTPFYSYTLQGGVLTGVLANGNELNSTFYIIEEADITFAIPEPKRVEIDIKPTSCPNPLNVDSGGVLPVAVLGSDEFDVTTVDIASVRLAGVAPMRSSYEDVSSPVADANDCTCTTAGGDGYDDLTLKFKTRQIVEALVAAEVDLSSGEELTLTFTGALSDGTPIEGADCMVVVGQVPRSIHAKRSDINGDGVVNMLDVAMVADNWLESSVVED